MGNHAVDLLARGGDVARARGRELGDVAVEARCAVTVPEEAEETAEDDGVRVLGGVRVGADGQPRGGFSDVRLAELGRRDTTCNRDEGFEWGDFAAIVEAAPVELGAEDLGDCWPRAAVFGWARSFWSASNWSAAALELKDLRRRRPDLSRQSA